MKLRDSAASSQCSEDISESDVSDVSWDDEADSAPIRAVLVPAPALPGAPAGAPSDHICSAGPKVSKKYSKKDSKK